MGMSLEIRKDLKDKKWKVNLLKGKNGRTLHSMIISDGLLVQMCMDYFVNLKGGKGFALEVETSVGPYLITCRRIEIVNIAPASEELPVIKETKIEDAGGEEEVKEDIVGD